MIATQTIPPINQVLTEAKSRPKLPTTKRQQNAASPLGVLAELIVGNECFISGHTQTYDQKASVKQAVAGQYPKAAILSCLDSRVPPEQIFDQGIGDLFVGRVAGNVANSDLIGSLEFATKVAGSKLVLVLGHTDCGAVKAACDGVKLGNLTTVLQKISSSASEVTGFPSSSRNSKNSDFVNLVAEENVYATIAKIRNNSEILLELENSGDIMIVGGIYQLETGRVKILPERKFQALKQS